MIIPMISDKVLEETLPELTAIYIFSYGFTTEGELVPPSRNEDWMIAAAHQQGVRPVLTLTPLDFPDSLFFQPAEKPGQVTAVRHPRVPGCLLCMLQIFHKSIQSRNHTALLPFFQVK